MDEAFDHSSANELRRLRVVSVMDYLSETTLFNKLSVTDICKARTSPARASIVSSKINLMLPTGMSTPYHASGTSNAAGPFLGTTQASSRSRASS